MKDIDTETSVVWPSWCYSDDIRKKLLKPNADIAKDSLVCESDILILAPITEASTKKRRVTTDTSSSSSSSGRYDSRSKQNKVLSSQAINDKMLSERSLLLSGYNNNSIDSVKKSREQSKTPPSQLSAAQAADLTVTPTTTAAAAAAYLYLEKVKNERMSPRVTAAQIDSLKDAIMESSAAAAAVAAAMVNNNNCTSINNNNNSNHNSSVNSGSSNHSNNSNSVLQIGNSLNNTSDELHSHSLPPSIGQQQQHQQSSAMHLHSNNVKRERLSPNATNGDLQSAISRSRSTTPSSFRGTSPQHSVHSSPSETVVPMHNLSTNLLNSFQQAASSSGRHNSINFSSGAVTTPNSGLPSDFSTRNYSDFMRSLAAKYNNTNPNDTSNSRRQAFFDATANNATKKTSTTTATKASYPPPAPSTSISKEVTITTTSSLPPPPPLSSGAISPGESALSHTQQSQMAAAAVASAAAASGGSVSPFMTSFLSSLPFAQGIFPPLIDMSSTQALITLARATKESEIHNILHLAQNTTKRTTANVSPSPSPSLNMALQQAAQFISPALIYSAQLQKQQLVSRQSSPRSTNITNSSSSSANAASNKNAVEKRNASPLDLSSQPPASKRFKAESTSSQSSSDGLLDVTIKQRRASTSTATTTPSPPPIIEKLSSPAGPAPAEAMTAAFTPMAMGSSTAATTGSAYAGVAGVRQCQAHSEEVNSWTVHDVCAFVGSIDICAEYVKHFRDQSIDGSGLPLLTEDHLVNSLGMKLGPALKLRSMLAKKLGGPCPCVACVAQAQQMLALQTGAGITAPTSSSGTLNATAVTDSGSCNSHLQKSSTLSNISATVAGSNCSSNNSNSHSSYGNKSDSTTTTTTSSSNAIAAPSYNSIEGGSSNAAGNGNCNINIATFPQPPPAYSNCSNNYNNNIGGSNSKGAASNRDDNAGSSSSTS